MKLKNENLDKAQNSQLNIGAVMPRLFYVVARNSEETWEQITQGLDTYEKAKNYRDSDFCKKRWEYAFIVCTINEA
jgi:hypothetical protein